jgi:hypothetical protein
VRQQPFNDVIFRSRLHSGSEVACTRVRSGVHGESSGADTRFPGGHVSWGSARGEAGGQAGAVRLSAGVVILVLVLGVHTGGERVALRVEGLGAAGLGNTEISDEYAHVLPDCHVTARLCNKAGPCWVRPRSCH